MAPEDLIQVPQLLFTNKAGVLPCRTTPCPSPEWSHNQAGTRMSLVQLLPTEDVSSHLITVTTTVGGGGGPGSADHTVHRAAGCTTDCGPSRLDPRQARHAAERSGVLTLPGALDLSHRPLSSLRKQIPGGACVRGHLRRAARTHGPSPGCLTARLFRRRPFS